MGRIEKIYIWLSNNVNKGSGWTVGPGFIGQYTTEPKMCLLKAISPSLAEITFIVNVGAGFNP